MCVNCSASTAHAQAQVSRGVLASVSGGDFAALGKDAKRVDGEGAKAKQQRAKADMRLARFAAKRTSASLLRDHDAKLGKRLSDCCYVSFAEKVELQRVTGPDGSVRGAVSGVVTCGSVWSCPVCSARISEDRRKELNHLLAWARGEGHRVAMLTLTARHNARTELAGFNDDLKGASRKMRQSRAWKSLPIVGAVTASEVTHGRNGWHPHLHVLLILDGSAGDPVELVEKLRSEWLRSLAKFGRDGNANAFQVQSGEAAGEYVAKFGAAEEIALGHKKQGRKGSRSPWQILSDARDGDARACALWVEYSLAFKGKRQLHWSQGLKDKCGLAEASEDAGDGEETRETLRAWPGAGEHWRAARRRLCALLSAAETGGSLNAAEFGPTDAARWRDELANSAVLE